jgi:hypothetical protein
MALPAERSAVGSHLGEFWNQQRVTGLSSGEGLIEAVADKVEKDGKGRVVKDANGRPIVTPTEKRLFVLEDEFCSVLIRMRRDGNTLSNVIRQAFDHGNLATLTVNPRKAVGAHICLACHVTPDDLDRHLSANDIANGWANRFLWLHVHKTKRLPRTEPIPAEIFKPFVEPLAALMMLGLGKEDLPVNLDAEAQELWENELYDALGVDQPGLFGQVIARGEPYVLRLALIYALLDLEPCKHDRQMLAQALLPDISNLCIRREHLEAALSVWGYNVKSADNLFGHKAVDRMSEKVLELLRAHQHTTSTLKTHFSNEQKKDVGITLARLERDGLIRRQEVPTSGRPATVWELWTSPGMVDTQLRV